MRLVYYFFFSSSLSSDNFYLLRNFKKAEKLGRFKMSPEFFFVKCIKNNVALFCIWKKYGPSRASTRENC
jgi:hypothetical protein